MPAVGGVALAPPPGECRVSGDEAADALSRKFRREISFARSTSLVQVGGVRHEFVDAARCRFCCCGSRYTNEDWLLELVPEGQEEEVCELALVGGSMSLLGARESYRAFVSLVQSLSALESLTLDSIAWATDGKAPMSAFLGSVLRHLKHLKRLELTGYGSEYVLSAQGTMLDEAETTEPLYETLSEALPALSGTLQHLKLCRHAEPPSSPHSHSHQVRKDDLWKGLSCLNRLEVIDLSSNDFDESDLAALCERVLPGMKRLSKLCLDHNAPRGHDTGRWITSLEVVMDSLTYLSLQSCGITPEMLGDILIPLLRRMKRLDSLDLRHNFDHIMRTASNDHIFPWNEFIDDLELYKLLQSSTPGTKERGDGGRAETACNDGRQRGSGDGCEEGASAGGTRIELLDENASVGNKGNDYDKRNDPNVPFME